MGLSLDWTPDMKKKALTLIYHSMFQTMMDPALSDMRTKMYSDMLYSGRAFPQIVANATEMVIEEWDQRSQILFRKAAWERRVNRMTEENVVAFYEQHIRLDDLDSLEPRLTPAMCRTLLIGLHQGDTDSMYDCLLNDFWMENVVDIRFVNMEQRARRVVQPKPAVRVVMNDSSKEMEECPVCYERPKDGVTTDCGHAFCLDCIQKIIKVKGASCPMCRSGVKEIVCHSTVSFDILSL